MNGDGANGVAAGACAVCKHQRKRCEENCPFARYFPAHKVEDFRKVYRLFGVNNVQRILDWVSDEDRDKTVETLILEAKIRHDNPVHGCFAVRKKLVDELKAAQEELDAVKQKLSFFKETEKLQQQRKRLENLLDQSSLLLLPLKLKHDSNHQPNEAIFLGDIRSFYGYNYSSTSDKGANIKFSESASVEITDSHPNEHCQTNSMNLTETRCSSKSGSEEEQHSVFAEGDEDLHEDTE